jgi:hypothetical protein
MGAAETLAGLPVRTKVATKTTKKTPKIFLISSSFHRELKICPYIILP